ncbi:cytochrome c biogenesis protein ResB [Natronoglycomyces albus]|uniref:Cytochrome c biogenesis protein ResB n=1 Tax=Natronoglycomyces albus TaxID=2811108 RepID=A0A895XNC6_9ACTN|nr:cytochrome c biogenesis protein ResB [Natronoglycomyces albus]QSB05043.1 cytochrome c biogenesis protein ResB [Natronoglycomyces albus]
MKRLAKATLTFARRWWHQLTSMRTALMLLLVLAMAAIPGSLLPQRDINPETVATYFADNPDLAPILDRLWLFDVYNSPWFAAIYLLLMISLIGCILPRTKAHLNAMRQKPPAAPQRLDLMPYHRQLGTSAKAEPEAVATWMKKHRFRSQIHTQADGSVSVAGEKGYLRETGNLLFHVSLIVILVGAALGSVYGWYGNRLLVEGEEHAFCNNLQQYHEYGLGPWVDETKLPPFCLRLDGFEAEFTERGQALRYEADLAYTEAAGEFDSQYDLRVNHPLGLDGANVFLLGHGFAPVLEYTDKYGVTQTSTMPFLPVDNALNSEGVALYPDANVNPETGRVDPNSQVGFEGLFIPSFDPTTPMLLSERPEPTNPALMMWLYRGDLGFDDGMPRSVYEIDPRQVEDGFLEGIPFRDTPGVRAAGADPDTEASNNDPAVDELPEAALLQMGDTWELDDGSVIEFVDYQRYIVLEIRHEPGHWILLMGSILLLGALYPMLHVRRRRFWVRFNPDHTVEVAGLNRTEYDQFTAECDALADDLTDHIGDLRDVDKATGSDEPPATTENTDRSTP